MASKLAFLLLSLFALSLISSEVTARDFSESSSNHAEVETMKHGKDAKRGGYDVGPPSYGVGPPSYGGGGGGGGYCRYGCCGGRYGGGCRRCCSYAGEAVDAQPNTEPQN